MIALRTSEKCRGSELKIIYIYNQTLLAVLAQHNKRLRLKFITFSIIIVLQNKYELFHHYPPAKTQNKRIHS